MLPWLFEAARPETTFCASYACPDLRKLISDTVSVAGGSTMSLRYPMLITHPPATPRGTDCIQVQPRLLGGFLLGGEMTFEAKLRGNRTRETLLARWDLLGYSQYHLR
jgi:hypothetical protein